ncbi:MAG: hypothetical protein JWO09_875 [Bacteroidetes bacterium]|nr:hypothetical protein [Bacteroidota bacterium]
MTEPLQVEKERLHKWAQWLIEKGFDKTPPLDRSTIRDAGDYIEETFSIHPAVLQLPKVFEEWSFDDDGNAYYIEDPFQVTVSSLILFFKINYYQLEHLLLAECQSPLIYGGTILYRDATHKQIGRQILEFLEKLAEG